MHARFGGWIQSSDANLVAVEHCRNFWRDFVFPVVAFVDSFVELFPVFFIVESPNPNVGVVVRLTNPSYYEGVMFAILLASIFSPLFDYLAVERNIKRRRLRLESNRE